jgi:regulator of protease activity HflC (stomatin/prohibitin superfamily)
MIEMTEEQENTGNSRKGWMEETNEKLKSAIKGVGWKKLAVVLASLVLFFISLYLFGVLLTITAILVFFVAPLLLVYFVLAPRDICFTFVEETTAKIVVRGGGFQRALLAWRGHVFRLGDSKKEETKWEIVEGEESWHPLGGLRFLGIWPFDRIFTYDFAWTHLHEDGQPHVHPKKSLDQVLLRIDSYVVECKAEKGEALEDKNLLPLSVKMVLPIRIVNPYTAVFITTKWLSLVSGIAKAVLREFVGRHTYQELVSMKEDDGLTLELWTSFKTMADKQGTDHEVKPEAEPAKQGEAKQEIRLYGVAVVQLGFRILSVEPPQEYREATTKGYVAEQDKKAAVIAAQAREEAAIHDTKARAQRRAGLFAESAKILQKDSGLTPEQASGLAAELTIREQAGDFGGLSLHDIRGVSENPLAAAAAVYGYYPQKIVQHQGPGGDTDTPKEKPGKKTGEKEGGRKLEEMSSEELAAEFRKHYPQ